MKIGDYIESVDPSLRVIVEILRKTIRETSIEFREEIKWNVPTYSINKNICSIMAHKGHVNLQVFQGAKIKDANKLDGTGKEMRHITFTKLGKVKVAEIRKYLKQAIALDE